MSYSEQVKEKIPISSIISQKVSLKGRGNGEFLGLCPFHQEKTPSFTVSDKKGFYHCFGCGAHGDIFTFLAETDGGGYKDNLEKLANIAGVNLPKNFLEPRKKQNEILFEIFLKVTEFYRNQLKSKAGTEAMAYLKSRGLKQEIIEKYELGFAPENSTAIVEMLNSRFSKQDLHKANILATKGIREYDPLHGRIIFPIHNQTGKVVAFGGRVLDDRQPKYLNSSENPLFEKSKILYGMHIAKPHIYKTQEAIITEGYMDVLSLSNYDLYNSVAPLGTSLKISQLEPLWRMVSQPTICMDADIAGRNAAIRVAKESLAYISSNSSLKFMQLTKGKDPDEVLRKFGLAGFQDELSNTIPLAQILFETERDSSNFNTPEEKTRLKERLNTLADKIPNHSLKNEYKRFFQNSLFKLFRHKSDVQKKSDPQRLHNSKKTSQYAPYEIDIFFILIKNPILLKNEKVIEELTHAEFSSITLDRLRDYVLSNTDALESIDVCTDAGGKDFPGEIGNSFDKLIDEICRATPIVTQYCLKDLEKRLMRAFKLNSLQALKAQIKEAEKLVRENKNIKSFELLIALKTLENRLKSELSII